MAKWKITYSDKRIKSEIVYAKTRGEALNKSIDYPYAFFKIRKMPVRRKNMKK